MTRRCEILTDQGAWRPWSFDALAPDMIFRLFEENGTPITEDEGRVRSWRVSAPLERNEDGALKTEPIPETDVEQMVRTQGWYWPGIEELR